MCRKNVFAFFLLSTQIYAFSYLKIQIDSVCAINNNEELEKIKIAKKNVGNAFTQIIVSLFVNSEKLNKCAHATPCFKNFH